MLLSIADGLATGMSYNMWPYTYLFKVSSFCLTSWAPLKLKSKKDFKTWELMHFIICLDCLKRNDLRLIYPQPLFFERFAFYYESRKHILLYLS